MSVGDTRTDRNTVVTKDEDQDDDERDAGIELSDESRERLIRAANHALAPIIKRHQDVMTALAKQVLPNLDHLIPNIDFAGLAQAQALARSVVLPQLNWLEGFQQQWLKDVVAQTSLLNVTMPPLPQFNIQLPEGIFDIIRGTDWERLSRRWQIPSNWADEFEDDLPRIVEIVNGEGIPVAWVPRSAILRELLDADSADDRSQILIGRRNEILEDCEQWIDSLEDAFVGAHAPMAKKVLAGCRDGHWEIAAISAVFVVHAVVEALEWVSDRQRVRKHHELKMEHPISKMLEQATRAPLVLFYDDWNPRSGRPRPAHLTRHVVSHHLGDDQVDERNCVIAVMLMASLLVTVQQLELGREEIDE